MTNNFKLVLAGLFLAFGVVIPFTTAHAFGIPGTVLLPMHLSIFMGALVLGPKYGALLGVLTPIVSSVLTGMPPAFPMLPIMIFELGTYGLITGWVFQKTNKIYVSMLPAMVVGRLVYGAVFTTLTLVSAAPLRALAPLAALTTGLPGIVLQLIFVPIVAKFILKYIENWSPEHAREHSN